jgi:hypothetical protein
MSMKIRLRGLMAKHDNKSMIKVLFQAARCSMRRRRYCLIDKGHRD